MTDNFQLGDGPIDGDPATLQTIYAVAGATGRDPTAIPSLHEAIDPDALDALVASGADSGRGTVLVSFTYDGTQVTVGSDGTVEVEE